MDPLLEEATTATVESLTEFVKATAGPVEAPAPAKPSTSARGRAAKQPSAHKQAPTASQMPPAPASGFMTLLTGSSPVDPAVAKSLAMKEATDLAKAKLYHRVRSLQRIAVENNSDPSGAIAAVDVRATASIAELQATEAFIRETMNCTELPALVDGAVVGIMNAVDDMHASVFAASGLDVRGVGKLAREEEEVKARSLHVDLVALQLSESRLGGAVTNPYVNLGMHMGGMLSRAHRRNAGN